MRIFASLCFLVALFAGPAAAKPTVGLRYASLTPDGKSVVFCYRGDIWVAQTDGKSMARRLTIHEEQDTVPRISPDGKTIAFASKRSGGYDLFTLPIEGGVPKQITFHSAFEVPCDWSPDGKKLLFASNRGMDTGRIDLYEIAVDGGTPRRITRDGGTEGSYSPDGKQVVYTRGFITIYWDNYTGSANHDLYMVPTAGGLPTRLTTTDGNERWPYFSADGKHLFFVAEEKGVANFYAMPAAPNAARKQISQFSGDDVHRPKLAADRKTACFERRGKLYTLDLTDKKAKAKAIKLEIKSDVRHSGIVQRTITSGGEQVHVSNDGRRAAFVLRGDIWTMAAGGGNARRLTSGPSKDQWPRWSPDGRSIAYFSNARGNDDIYIFDVRSSKKRQITKNRAGDFFHNWSPDGKSLVFCSERSGNKDIWTIEIESGALNQLTRNPSADDDPTYIPDGSGIVFDSGRGGPQAIYRMGINGSNVQRITRGTAFYQVPSVSPDSKLVVFEAMSPVAGRSMGLFVTSINGGPAMQLSPDGSTACWTANNYIYFTAKRGRSGAGGIYRVVAPASVHSGERVAFIGRVQIDQKKELGDLFDEAWLALRDGFYDPKMHKVDWKKMKTKYRPMAVDAENKDEWTNIVRQMLAELGASHLGIFGTGSNGTGVAPRLVMTGELGLEFDPQPLDKGARKVIDIVNGGPADKAGIRVGDVVIRIGSKKLKQGTNLDKVLKGTVGKEITVAFKPLSGDGLGSERSQKIKPIAGMQLRSIRQANWVKRCAETVKTETKTKKGEVAYIHLSAMNQANLAKFQQAVAGWMKNKKIKGMVLDVRENGGGNIHNQLMAILTSKPLARIQRRGMSEKVTQPLAVYWDRPTVVLTNERSFSDAEVFPYMFMASGRGKVVGVPTPGGVIGTNDITLSDGTRFRVPRVGFWGMDGTNLEGLGVKPDIIVVETSADRRDRKDPQLMKAINVVEGEIKVRDAELKAKKDAAKKKAAAAKAKAKANKKPDPKKTDPKKTTPKPDPKKTEPKPKPQPNPGNPTVATAGDAINPMADIRTGEWVRYRVTIPGTDGESIVKVSVTEVTEANVRLNNELERGVMMPPLPDILKRQGVLDMLPMFGQLLAHKIVDGSVEQHDAKVLHAEMKWPDGSDITLEVTNVIPAYGLLRVTMKGKPIIEAFEWSRPEKTKAVAVARTAETQPKETQPKETQPVPADVDEAQPAPGDVEEAKAATAEPTEEELEANGDPRLPLSAFFDAVEGEWVRRKRTMRGREVEVTTKIVEVDTDDNKIFLQRTLHDMPMRDGSTRDITVPQRRKIDRRKHMRAPKGEKVTDFKVSLEPVTVEVDGKELTCFTISYTRGDNEIVVYQCKTVPVDGIVRVERNGDIVEELLEWGNDDDE